MHRSFALRAAIAGTLLLAACSAERVRGVPQSWTAPPAPRAVPAPWPGDANSIRAGLRSDSPRPVQRPQPPPSPCGFVLAGIADDRDMAGLGSMGPTEVDGEGFVAWLDSSVRAIPGYDATAPSLALRLELLKAYIEPIGTLKSANIVVRTRVDTNGTVVAEKLYRGADGSMNWANGEGEIQDGLARAMSSLMLQIRNDLPGWCNRALASR